MKVVRHFFSNNYLPDRFERICPLYRKRITSVCLYQ